jgi:hypothetical protein
VVGGGKGVLESDDGEGPEQELPPEVNLRAAPAVKSAAPAPAPAPAAETPARWEPPAATNQSI